MTRKRNRNKANDDDDDDDDDAGPFWACARCTLKNPMRKRRCGACEAHRPLEIAVVQGPSTTASISNNRNDATVASWLKKRKRKRQQQQQQQLATDNNADDDIDDASAQAPTNLNAEKSSSSDRSFPNENGCTTEKSALPLGEDSLKELEGSKVNCDDEQSGERSSVCESTTSTDKRSNWPIDDSSPTRKKTKSGNIEKSMALSPEPASSAPSSIASPNKKKSSPQPSNTKMKSTVASSEDNKETPTHQSCAAITPRTLDLLNLKVEECPNNGDASSSSFPKPSDVTLGTLPKASPTKAAKAESSCQEQQTAHINTLVPVAESRVEQKELVEGTSQSQKEPFESCTETHSQPHVAKIGTGLQIQPSEATVKTKELAVAGENSTATTTQVAPSPVEQRELCTGDLIDRPDSERKQPPGANEKVEANNDNSLHSQQDSIESSHHVQGQSDLQRPGFSRTTAKAEHPTSQTEQTATIDEDVAAIDVKKCSRLRDTEPAPTTLSEIMNKASHDEKAAVNGGGDVPLLENPEQEPASGDAKFYPDVDQGHSAYELLPSDQSKPVMSRKVPEPIARFKDGQESGQKDSFCVTKVEEKTVVDSKEGDEERITAGEVVSQGKSRITDSGADTSRRELVRQTQLQACDYQETPSVRPKISSSSTQLSQENGSFFYTPASQSQEQQSPASQDNVQHRLPNSPLRDRNRDDSPVRSSRALFNDPLHGRIGNENEQQMTKTESNKCPKSATYAPSASDKFNLLQTSADELAMIDHIHPSGNCDEKESSVRNVDSDTSSLPIFSTAGSGKQIQVSETSLARASFLLASDHKTNVHSTKRKRLGFPDSQRSRGNITNSTCVPTSSLPVFETAGKRKKLRVSEYSLAQASTLLLGGNSKEPGQFRHDIQQATKEVEGSSSRLTFFRMGNAQPEKLPDETGALASSLLPLPAESTSHERVSFHNETAKKAPATSASSAGMPMFTTAGKGKELKVSADSIARASSLLHEGNSSASVGPRVLETPGPGSSARVSRESFGGETAKKAPATSVSSAGMPMFTTAGKGKELKVSADSIARASLMLHEGNSSASFGPRVLETPDPGLSGRVSRESFDGETAKKAPATSVSSTGIEDGRAMLEKEERIGESSEATCSTMKDQRQESQPIPYAFFSAERAILEGIMTNAIEDCMSNGCGRITLEIDSYSGPLLRYDKHSLLPVSLSLQDEISSGTVGDVKDFRSMLASFGCDASLVSDKWILNHSRWIVWKLASIERRFCPFVEGHCLTFQQVAEQMKIRFTREIVDGFRSPLRRVLNRDVSAQRMMVLCVSSLEKTKDHKRNEDNLFCELTDGWYSVRASLDPRLIHFVQQGRIRIGAKLLISAAFLMGFDDGIDPLDSIYDTKESATSPSLCIFANACRLARWNAKLGFVGETRKLREDEGMLRVRSISDLFEDGGKIPMIDLIVIKRHPVMFLNQDEESGKAKILSEAEESERIRNVDKDRQRLIEKYADDIERECLQVGF